MANKVENLGYYRVGLSILAGAVLSIFYYSGRWGLARLVNIDELKWAYEPRNWLVLFYIICTILSLRLPFNPEIKLTRGMALDTVIIRFGLIIILFYVAFSIFWAPVVPSCFVKLYEISFLLILTISLTIMLSRLDILIVIKSYWISFCGFSILFALMAIPAVLSALKSGDFGRLAVLGGGANQFGRNMGFLFIGSLFFIQLNKNKVFWTLAALMGGIMLFLSGSRGALLSTTIALIVYLWSVRIKMVNLIIYVSIGIVTLILFLVSTPFGQAIIAVYNKRIVRLLLNNSEGVYTSGRDVLYNYAIELGNRYPFFGGGLGGFNARDLGVYPHNIFLEFYAETGLFGLFIFVSFFILFLTFIFRYRDKVYPQNVAGFFLAFTFSQFSGDFYANRAVFIFLLLTTALKQPENGSFNNDHTTEKHQS